MSSSDQGAGALFGAILSGAKRAARSTAHSTRRATRCAKLRVDIAAKRDQAKKLFTEIGELYYEAHRDDPEGFFVQRFQQLDALNESIEAMQAELDFWKADGKKAPAPPAEDSDITVEIEVEPEETEPAETEAPAD